MVWGFMGGVNEQQQVQDQHALSQLSLQEGQAKLRDDDLNYQIANTQFQRQQQMWAMMKQIGAKMSAPSPMGQNQGSDQIAQNSSTTDKLTNTLNEYAQGLFGGGFFEEGAKTIEDMAKLQNSNVEILRAHAEVQQQQIRDFQMRIQMIDPNDPDRQQKFAQALQETAQRTGLKMPIDPNTPFTPELQQRIKMIGETALQATERQLKEAEIRKTDTQTEVNKEKVKLEASQAKSFDALANYRNKHAGMGSVPKVPTLTQLQTWSAQEIGKELQVDTTDSAQEATLKADALDVAARARAIIIKSGGQIEPQDAVRMATTEFKVKGTFAGLGSSAIRNQPGFSAENAADLPKNVGSVSDAQRNTILDDNTWYKNPNGVPMLWKRGQGKNPGKFYTAEQLRQDYIKQRQADNREISQYERARAAQDLERGAGGTNEENSTKDDNQE